METTKLQHIISEAIQAEIDALDNIMFNAVDIKGTLDVILEAKGRVIITGIGKSAHVARRMVATFNSTGTPAAFLHTADAVHGDIGMVNSTDVIICISNSGETSEFKTILPIFNKKGICIIAITGNKNSYLGKSADFVIHSGVTREACPHDITPTCSLTVQSVIGNVLAVCLLEMRGFTQGDFVRTHPGGVLGKKLYMKVGDVYSNNATPNVFWDASLTSTLCIMIEGRLGAVAVIKDYKVFGIITDGDVRRYLAKNAAVHPRLVRAEALLSKNPRTITPDTLLVEALAIMRDNKITQLIVENDGEYLGMIHLHDILKEGIL